MTRAMLLPVTTQLGGPCTLPESVPPGAGAVNDTVGVLPPPPSPPSPPSLSMTISRVALAVCPALLYATAFNVYGPSWYLVVSIQQPRPLSRLPSVLVQTPLM